MISDDAIVLLGHLAEKTPEPGFDVDNGDVELARRQGPGQCGIGIAIHNYVVGFSLYYLLFDFYQHRSGHISVRAGAHIKIHYGLWDIHTSEKNLGHVVIVMLTGMDDIFGNAGGKLIPNQSADYGGLDELRPGTDYGHDFDHFCTQPIA